MKSITTFIDDKIKRILLLHNHDLYHDINQTLNDLFSLKRYVIRNNENNNNNSTWSMDDEYRHHLYSSDEYLNNRNEFIFKDTLTFDFRDILTVINEIQTLATKTIKIINNDDKDFYKQQQQQQQLFNLVLILNVNYNNQFDNCLISMIEELKDLIHSIKFQIYHELTIETLIYNTKQSINSLVIDSINNKCLKNLLKRIENIIFATTTTTTTIKEDKCQIHDYKDKIDFDKYNFQLSNIPIPNPIRGIIPKGVIGVHYQRIENNFPIRRIPESVIYIKFDEFNKPLSEIKFPSNLKFLSLGRFSQFIYRNIDIPPSVTHLEIVQHGNTIDNHMDHYAYHWLFCKGTLPRNVTHLKIIDPPMTQTISTPILIPSSVKYLDFNNNNNIGYYNFQIIDQSEYYKESITKDSFNNLNTLKYVKFPRLELMPDGKTRIPFPEYKIRSEIRPTI
ncbi:hypothetical protein CYY_010207, partial [Polysphondylium violaceum]